ncbi:MAG: hypothetical protein BWZ03_00505 [bacterium ADurb.BinA186]|nr:MAG: hypothetical protein BWZ03_00505 [bacterium ADurb.BinA186]
MLAATTGGCTGACGGDGQGGGGDNNDDTPPADGGGGSDGGGGIVSPDISGTGTFSLTSSTKLKIASNTTDAGVLPTAGGGDGTIVKTTKIKSSETPKRPTADFIYWILAAGAILAAWGTIEYLAYKKSRNQ